MSSYTIVAGPRLQKTARRLKLCVEIASCQDDVDGLPEFAHIFIRCEASAFPSSLHLHDLDGFPSTSLIVDWTDRQPWPRDLMLAETAAHCCGFRDGTHIVGDGGVAFGAVQC